MADAATISGTVESVRAYEAQDGYVSATLDDGRHVGGITDEKLATGLAYRFHGAWVGSTRKPGSRSFRFAAWAHVPETDPDATLNFLLKIARMPEQQARRLLAEHGTETARKIAKGQVMGVRPDEQSLALSALMRSRAREHLYGTLHGRGFPLGQLIRACLQKWREKAAVVVQNSPFQLLIAEMPGCGFKRVDLLYLSLGHAPTALKRQMLCAWNHLASLSNGDTWHEAGKVMEVMKATFGGAARPAKAIQLGIRARWLCERVDAAGERWLAEAAKAQDEAGVVAEVRRLLAWEGKVVTNVVF